jgi:hypothetical protein
MNRLFSLTALPLLLLTACNGATHTRPYDNNDFQLVTAYGAKDLCSCLFVMRQSDEFCANWTRASPNIKTVRVDRENRVVETQAVLFWSARARYVSPRFGCVLE